MKALAGVIDACVQAGTILIPATIPPVDTTKRKQHGQDANRMTSPFRKGTVPFSLRENRDSPQVGLLQPLRASAERSFALRLVGFGGPTDQLLTDLLDAFGFYVAVPQRHGVLELKRLGRLDHQRLFVQVQRRRQVGEI